MDNKPILIILCMILMIQLASASLSVYTNPVQPVIEDHGIYNKMWLYMDLPNGTGDNQTKLIELYDSDSVLKSYSTLGSDNYSNLVHTFNYDNDNWGDWSVNTSQVVCIKDLPPFTDCTDFLTTKDLCSNGYEFAEQRNETTNFQLDIPAESVYSLSFYYYGTCDQPNLSFYLNDVWLVNYTNLPVSCTCSPSHYPEIINVTDTALLNSTWNHGGVNNFSIKLKNGLIIQGLGTAFAGAFAVINYTNTSGESTSESETIKVGKFNMTETSSTCNETGFYPCIKEYDIHYDYVNPQQYSLVSVLDDLGSLRAPWYYNLTGNNKILAPEYSGKWDIYDFEGIMRGGGRLDESNIDYGTFYNGIQPIFYEYNESHWLVGTADYNGYVMISTWDGDTDESKYTSSDWGYFHGSNVWCDILPEGGDGLPEFIAVEDTGYMLIYNISTPSITVTLAYQSSDFGSSSYGIKPFCADIDGDGDNDSIMRDSSGRLRWVNASGTSIEEHILATDYGSFYTELEVLDIDEDGVVEVVTANTDGYIEILSWNGTAFIRNWRSGDLGYFYYTDMLDVLDIDRDGDLDIVAGDYYGGIHIARQNTNTSYFTTTFLDSEYLFHSKPQCVKDRNGFCHFVNGYYMSGDIVVVDYFRDTTSVVKHYEEFEIRKYREQQSYEFFTANMLNVDFDGDGDEEILIPQSEGYVLYYDLINNTEISLNLNYSHELSLVTDYMKKDPETKLVGNRIYCYNDINVALGETNIIKNTGGAVTNGQRLTDGLRSSTTDRKFNQLSSDYGNIDSGVGKWIQLNLSETYNIGKIVWTDRFQYNYHTQNLSVAVSDDYVSWTTVYNATDDFWLTGATHYVGKEMFFEPQSVKYIRVYLNGIRDSYTSSNTNNYFTELEAFEGNNCSFMFVPLEKRNATGSNGYNISIEPEHNIYYNKNYDIVDKKWADLDVVSRWLVWQNVTI